jgi:hypothetical protein
MTTSTLLIVNSILGILAVAAVAALARLAHRLPTAAPHSDSSWGTAGDPWVVSDPLPFRELADHEDERVLERAA